VPDNRQFAASSAVAQVAKMANSHEALRSAGYASGIAVRTPVPPAIGS